MAGTGIELATAYVSVVPSTRGFGQKVSREVGPEMDRAGKASGSRFGKVFASSSIKPIRALGAAAVGLFAIDKISGFFKDANAEARESQKVSALTAQVIKTTGGAAKVTASQVGQLATAISNKSGIDDEAIQSASNLLLSFQNVRNEAGKGNDVFNQATQAATDLGAAMGKSPRAAALQLGKALNDPIKGISALGRAGVTFTAQQKEQIKTLVQSGDTLGAQKIVLGEVQKKFGGAAAAQATAGDKLRVAFDNFKETVGTALLPVIDKVAAFLTEKVIPAVSGFVTGIQDGTGAGGKFRDLLSGIAGFLKRNADVILPLIGALGAMFAAFKVITAVVRAYTAVQTALNFVLTANPIGLVIVLIAALVAGLVLAYKKSDTFRAIVDGAFRAVGAAATWLWEKAIKPAFDFIKGAFKAIGTAISSVWTDVLRPTFKFITDAFLAVAGAIVQGAADAFGWIPGIGGKLKTAAEKFNTFRDKVNTALSGVKDRNVTVTASGMVLTRKGGKGPTSNKFIPLADGGPVPMVAGAQRGRDSVPAVLMPDEFVIRADGSNLADALRHFGAPGYAAGGLIPRGRAARIRGNFPPRFDAAVDRRLGPKAAKILLAQQQQYDGTGTLQRGNGVGSRASLVAFGLLLRRMGYSVTEGPPPFGPVHRVHAPNSRHYSGRAIDVNHGAGTSTLEQAFLRKIIPLGHSYGLSSIFMRPGHYNHAHFQYDQGGWLQPGRTVVDNNTGKPEAVFNQEQLAALTSRSGGVVVNVGAVKDVDEMARKITEAQQTAATVANLRSLAV